MTPSDLELYETVSSFNLKDLNKLLYATIIITGNYEHQDLNAFVAGLWARHFHTHIIRWKKIKSNTTSGKVNPAPTKK